MPIIEKKLTIHKNQEKSIKQSKEKTLEKRLFGNKNIFNSLAVKYIKINSNIRKEDKEYIIKIANAFDEYGDRLYQDDYDTIVLNISKTINGFSLNDFETFINLDLIKYNFNSKAKAVLESQIRNLNNKLQMIDIAEYDKISDYNALYRNTLSTLDYYNKQLQRYQDKASQSVWYEAKQIDYDLKEEIN